jgi:hypothetical protein
VHEQQPPAGRQPREQVGEQRPLVVDVVDRLLDQHLVVAAGPRREGQRIGLDGLEPRVVGGLRQHLLVGIDEQDRLAQIHLLQDVGRIDAGAAAQVDEAVLGAKLQLVDHLGGHAADEVGRVSEKRVVGGGEIGVVPVEHVAGVR